MEDKDKKFIEITVEDFQIVSEVNKLWLEDEKNKEESQPDFILNDTLHLGKGKYRVFRKPNIRGKTKGNC